MKIFFNFIWKMDVYKVVLMDGGVEEKKKEGNFVV